MKPRSIIIFGRLYAASTALGFFTVLFNYGSLREYSVSRGGAAAISLVVAVLSVAVSILFWFLIVHRAQAWAKWFITVMAVIGLVGMVSQIPTGAYGGLSPTYIALSAISSLLNIAAILFLFRADARPWFASIGEMAVDPAVFE